MLQIGLETLLMDSYFFYFFILFSVFVFLLIFNKKNILNRFKTIKRKYLLILFLIFLIAISFRLLYVNHVYQVYSDEYALVNVAKNFVFDQSYSLCTSRLTFNCANPSYNPWPIGGSFFYYLVFIIIGIKFSFLFFFNSILGSLSVFLVFLIAYFLFRKEKIALFLSLIFAVYPIHMKLSGSAALGVSSLFFMLLTLIIFLIYSENQNLRNGFLLLFSLVIFSNIRLENFLILTFIIPYYFMNMKKKKQDLYFLAFYFVFMLPFILNVFVGLNREIANWTTSLNTHYHTFISFFTFNISFLLKDYSNLFFL